MGKDDEPKVPRCPTSPRESNGTLVEDIIRVGVPVPING